MPSRARSLLWVVVVYAGALAVAWAVSRIAQPAHPLVVVLAADVAATVAVFAASWVSRNSSLYDPYWSVAPAVIALWWVARPEANGGVDVRQALVIGLIVAWGIRLTWNWARGWSGLGHQDWRYVQLQEQTGRAYWLVSFLGIHLMPTLLVYAGCLGVYVALAGRAGLGWLDGVALAVTVGAIALEAVADHQLRRFVLQREPGQILTSGLWGWSRHPNYLGELGLWWGLWLFGVAAAPAVWWTIVGPLAMTGLFVGISLPLMERRMAGRAGWEAYARRVPRLVPRPWR